MKNELIFTCDYHKYIADEHVIPAHGLVHVFEGELEMNDGLHTFLLKPKDTYFAAKNTLLRFTKLASRQHPLKTVAIAFTPEMLRDFYTEQSPELNKPKPAKHFRVNTHPLWDTFFQSLKPYQDLQDALPAALLQLKQQEAFHILRSVQPGIDHLLSDFSAPGKIDLEAFMQRNYIFNLPLERFAYLSGRSISSFKRDFAAIFNATPQRWLTFKRLELAHYLIKEKHVKPSDAYIEAGFENLSHFSAAFKNQYGYNPSQIAK
jgi:AraC family transcriptional regulator, exoenzyme S synthesis regulatory protein ExsA